MSKVREWKGAGWECNLKVTFTLLKVQEPTHSQGDSHFGSWNSDGISNLQRVILKVKIH